MEFLRYPHLIRQLFNGGRFGPPWSFTPTSPWTWIGHPVSGLIHGTYRAVHTRFPCGSASEMLNHAPYINSPDRSTKSTTSSLNALCVLVNTRFQVLFHSPPGVLFTFPSQYCSTIGHQVVFRLGGWSPRLQCGFHVSAPNLDPVGSLKLRLPDYHRLWLAFPRHSSRRCDTTFSPNPEGISTLGLASSAFARRY